MHILFLSDNFPPEGNAPATRTYEHAREWIKQGHQVTVITCAPNFPEGKVYVGYKNRWYQREVMSGINVVRVKSYIAANEGFAKRILDYISFALMACLVGLFQKKPDVIVATSPQFFCACGGWLLSALRFKPWVFELRDIWPASITAVGAMEKSRAINWLEKLEMFLYRRADQIVAVTHSFKTELVQRGIDGEKIDVVVNGVDLKTFQPVQEKNKALTEEYNLSNKFVVAYIGTHGMAHALDKVLDAAALLQEHRDICILFAGGGAARENVEQMVAQRGLLNVSLIPRQPKDMMPALWSLCDVSLISLRDTPLFEKVIPSKIFESMGMGLPMIITCPEGEATGIVRSTSSGIVVPPEQPRVLADAILELYKDEERRKTLAVNSFKAAPLYDRETMALKMLDVFNAVKGS